MRIKIFLSILLITNFAKSAEIESEDETDCSALEEHLASTLNSWYFKSSEYKWSRNLDGTGGWWYKIPVNSASDCSEKNATILTNVQDAKPRTAYLKNMISLMHTKCKNKVKPDLISKANVWIEAFKEPEEILKRCKVLKEEQELRAFKDKRVEQLLTGKATKKD